MDVVEWISVISGTVGVTLSLVAIWFAVMVDGRSRTVTDQTTKSLQKIETSVERQSQDTQELIKAGWDRLLGNAMAGRSALPEGNSETRALAAGIASELRASLFNAGDPEESDNQDGPGDAADRDSAEALFDDSMQELVRLLAAQGSAPTSPRTPVDKWIDILQGLDPVAFALARSIRNSHLERREYMQLLKRPDTRQAIRELRDVGLLSPLASHGGEGGPPVYWYAPGVSSSLNAAYALSDRKIDPETWARVRSALQEVGYVERLGSSYSD